jgi:glycerol-3-phosphate dehydrogenase
VWAGSPQPDQRIAVIRKLCAISAPLATTSLNAARRASDLAHLADGAVVDVLVVGLGVTGAGAALDAASRGLSVAAVDAHDLAFGTSRWSSKLVHGGLRYLAHLDVAVAYECAQERHVLMTRTAPHLTHPLPALLPLSPNVSRGVARLHRAGIVSGDVLRVAAGTPSALLPRARRLSAAQALRWAPGLRAGGLRGGNLNWDGQLEDDARLVVAIARTAAGLGARILTRCRALELSGDGARVRDELTGTELTIRARSVVNAAGVWAGSLVTGVRLRPSRGTHLVLRTERLGGLDAQLLVPVPDRRAQFVFAVPQPGGLTYVGITDEPVDGIEEVPAAPESDVAFLLDILGTAFTDPPRRPDVVGTFAGLRPLLDDGSAQSADTSRRHAILTSPEGVVTVVGGKLTTYRRMAEQAVDATVRRHGLAAGPSRTRRLPLVGAAPRTELARIDAPARLVRRYGTEAPGVARLSTMDDGLGRPLAPGVEATGAELVWALRHEGALDIDDLLDRRTRIGLVPADRAAALPAAQAILAAY